MTLHYGNPKYTFEQGIKEFAKWVSTQEIEVSKYEASIKEMKEKESESDEFFARMDKLYSK